MNISASAPICSAIEKVPTDQASLEAVLGFMVEAILPGAPHKGKREGATSLAREALGRGDSAGIGTHEGAVSAVGARFAGRRRQERPPFSFGPQPAQGRWSKRPSWIALLVALAVVVAGGAGAAIAWRAHRSAEARSRAELERTVD